MNATGQHPTYLARIAGRLHRLSLIGTLLLSACGGGGSGGGGNSGATPAVIVNQPPLLSGTPADSVDVGSRYDFTPAATDANGDRLAFSISGQPAWASFDPGTGHLYGTPGQLGAYANIVITVSDGKVSTSLPAFRIQVVGAATLTWTAPIQNMDGSVLKDLAGYLVYYGTSTATLLPVAAVTDPATHSYRIGGLSPGTWYFAVTAFNDWGVESPLSNIGSKTIR